VLVSGIISSDPRYPATFGHANLSNAVLCHSFTGHPPNVYDFDWLASASDIDLLIPGEQVMIVGYGGAISHFVRSSALIELVGQLS
jgi:hypothetical protein